MLCLDHLAVVAPSLGVGAAHVSDRLALAPDPGGAHPLMGTHNALMRLGESVYLEIISVDPAAPAPARRRWFGLDDRAAVHAAWRAGRRLGAWIARTNDMAAFIARHGDVYRDVFSASRGSRRWTFAMPADGLPPMDGALPFVIEWDAQGSPAPAMPDRGVSLDRLTIETPSAAEISARLVAFAFEGAVEVVEGSATRLRAAIRTPRGLHVLT